MKLSNASALFSLGMAGVAHLVRALGCGSGGSGFETRHSPHSSLILIVFLVQMYFSFAWFVVCCSCFDEQVLKWGYDGKRI
jgi:hypothetical protein